MEFENFHKYSNQFSPDDEVLMGNVKKYSEKIVCQIIFRLNKMNIIREGSKELPIHEKGAGNII